MAEPVNNGVSFGKKLGSVSYENFNGIAKSDFENSKNKALAESVFSKYDTNNDGILDRSELKAMQDDLAGFANKKGKLGRRDSKKFMKSVDPNLHLKREDLKNFLSEIAADTDSVQNAEKNATGGATVTYKPDNSGTVKTAVYDKDNNLSSQINEFADGTGEEIIFEEGNSQLVTKYKPIEGSEDVEVTSYQRINGAVVEDLDPDNDRVTQRTVDKGNGIKDVTKFEYADTGEITATNLNPDGLPQKVTVTKDGKTVRTTDYAYDGDNTTEVRTEGDKRTRIVTTKSGDASTISERVALDAEGNVLPLEYNVQDGENWYGIVQAKYGVTDHKATMAIIHQLKDAAGIRYNSKTMPDIVTLPPEMTVGGDTFKLKDIEGKIDEIHSAQSRITPPPRKSKSEIPQKYSGTMPAKSVTIPQYPVNKSKADQKVTDDKGVTLQYDSEGRVICKYDTPEMLEKDNNSFRLYYNTDGSLNEYQINHYDNDGNFSGAVDYNSKGKLSYFFENQGIAAETGNYKTQIKYNANGKTHYYISDYEYDEKDRNTKYNTYNPDGSLDSTWIIEYSNDGTKCRTLKYDAQGKLISDTTGDA